MMPSYGSKWVATNCIKMALEGIRIGIHLNLCEHKFFERRVDTKNMMRCILKYYFFNIYVSKTIAHLIVKSNLSCKLIYIVNSLFNGKHTSSCSGLLKQKSIIDHMLPSHEHIFHIFLFKLNIYCIFFYII